MADGRFARNRPWPTTRATESPVRSLIPILLVAAAAVGVYAYRRHERRIWEARRISGGRKALALWLADRR